MDQSAKKRTSSGRTTRQQQSGRRTPVKTVMFSWPFGKRNLLVLIVGLVVIIIGYIFLGIGPYDSVSSMTVAPILLVLGYLIIIPLAIVVKDPGKGKGKRA